jgi:hypothetical protein
VKHKYRRRKILWDFISILVRGGLAAGVATDQTYDFYGRAESLVTIINKMKNCRRNGILFPL